MLYWCAPVLEVYNHITDLLGNTGMCLLTNISLAILIPNKSAERVIQAYLQHLYVSFGDSLTLITDDGRELKNELLLK